MLLSLLCLVSAKRRRAACSIWPVRPGVVVYLLSELDVRACLIITTDLTFTGRKNMIGSAKVTNARLNHLTNLSYADDI